MKPIIKVVGLLAVVGASIAAGFLLGRSALPETAPASAAPAERKVLYWYDPMAPDQHFDKPGKSPFMDMDLVPKYADEVSAGGVRIDADLQQSLGIRTDTVESGRLPSAIRVPGTLSWDLREESVVTSRVDAQITSVQVKAPYTPVRRGDTLVRLLAPEWRGAIAEAQALRHAETDAARGLQEAARKRLSTLGVPAGNLGADGSVGLVAPRDGIVTEVLAREGQFVAAGTPLFRINGTRTLWLEAAVPQSVAASLVPGTPVRASVTAIPGRDVEGEVQALLSQVDPASRTQTARIVLQNPEGRLAPGMFVEVEFQPDTGGEVLLVPTEALVASGPDSRVIVADAQGAFSARPVRVGRSAAGQSEILAGLSEGERIVVSGQFLIDSEANLSGALQRLETPAAEPSSASPAHEDHGAERNCPVQYWYDPMVPDQHFDAPGKSPFMDMRLVPKFAAGAEDDCTIEDVAVTTPEKTP